MITPLPGVDDAEAGIGDADRFPASPRRSAREQGERVEVGGGLLALTRPWPSMLRGIYGDPDRYVRQHGTSGDRRLRHRRRREARRRRLLLAARTGR